MTNTVRIIVAGAAAAAALFAGGAPAIAATNAATPASVQAQATTVIGTVTSIEGKFLKVTSHGTGAGAVTVDCSGVGLSGRLAVGVGVQIKGKVISGTLVASSVVIL